MDVFDMSLLFQSSCGTRSPLLTLKFKQYRRKHGCDPMQELRSQSQCENARYFSYYRDRFPQDVKTS